MSSMIVSLKQILQHIDVSVRVLCGEVLPHPRLECSVEALDHRCILITLARKVMDSFLFQKILHQLVHKFFSLVRLQAIRFPRVCLGYQSLKRL